MRERQQSAVYLRQLTDEIQGLRSQVQADDNIQRNAVMASIVAALSGKVNQKHIVDDPIPSIDAPEIDVTEIAAPIENSSILEDDVIDAIDIKEEKVITESEESALLENGVKSTPRKAKKDDAKTQLIEWMLQQSQSNDESKWYIRRIMENTLPLADILYEMPESINVGRAAMIKLFSSIRSGDYTQMLENGMSEYGLPRNKVFVANRAPINAAPPTAKRGRKNKE